MELAPFYYLKSNFGYEENKLWPIIILNRVPGPIELELIHAAFNLNLRLEVDSWKTFDGISNELRSKVTEFNIVHRRVLGRISYNQRFRLLIIFNRK